MKKNKALPDPEWSYPFHIDDLEKNAAHTLTISADQDSLVKLARRMDIKAIHSLQIAYKIGYERDGLRIRVNGELDADIVQECVVSLDDIKTKIEERFEAWFAEHDKAVSFLKARKKKNEAKGHTETPILEEHEDPEAIIAGVIDLGELAAQYLSLAIDPYATKDGVEYDGPRDDEIVLDKTEVRKNPFAALKDWKDKIKSED